MSHRHRGQRQDVKSRTMKYAALDPDITSKYDELDEDDNRLLRFQPPRQGLRPDGNRNMYWSRDNDSRRQQPKYIGSLRNDVKSIIERHLTRKDQNTMRTTGAGTSSSKRELMNLITVKGASRSGKEHVLKLLANSVDQFMPLAPIMKEGDLSFFIANEDDAQAVCLMSKRIADKQNPSIKYTIYSKRQQAPFDSISFANRQIIEQVVKSRYKKQTNSLDLSSFQNDPLFEKHRLMFGLFHNNAMVVVADCVQQNFPSIRGIRLNNNSLRTLDYVGCLVYAAPDVIELDLANNAIPQADELAHLRNWNLESVHFENNGFASNFDGNFTAYSHAIHEYFPRVTYLDGRSVQAVPDMGDSALSAAIPRFRVGYDSDESLRKMTESFLVEYYTFYDGPNGEVTRQKLMNAYDANATFTYSFCFLSDTHSTIGNRDRTEHQDLVGQYIRSSHNIIKQHKWQNYRDRIIYRGPMDIAVAISKLPPTHHIKQSFLLDFNLVSNNVMVVVLQGIFRDGKEILEDLTTFGNVKFFARQFAIVPKAEGLAIISDILQITPVSTARMERYNNLMKNAAATQPQQLASLVQQQFDGMAPPPPSPQQIQEGLLPSTSSILMPGLIKQEPSSTSALKQQDEQLFRESMIKQFCAFSGMKPAWSEKCLQDCKWNWEDAKVQFSMLKDSVPRDAFV